MTAISPLAPARFPDMPPVPGRSPRRRRGEAALQGPPRSAARVVPAGEPRWRARSPARTRLRRRCTGAGRCWARADGGARALVVNAGNANAATGEQGHAAVRRTAEAAAGLVGCRCRGGLRQLDRGDRRAVAGGAPDRRAAGAARAPLGRCAWPEAARAIMTTDTYPKGATASAEIDGVPVVVNGIAKGSGMIAPNMGTMLAYVFTDANLPAAVLRPMVRRRCQPLLQRHHGGRRHVHQRHLPALRHRRRPAPADRARRRCAAAVVPRRVGGGADRSRPADRAGRPRAPRSSSRSPCAARPRRRPRASSGSPSPTRRWSRPRSPARTPNWGRIVAVVGRGRRGLRSGAARDLARGRAGGGGERRGRPRLRRARPRPAT